MINNISLENNITFAVNKTAELCGCDPASVFNYINKYPKGMFLMLVVSCFLIIVMLYLPLVWKGYSNYKESLDKAFVGGSFILTGYATYMLIPIVFEMSQARIKTINLVSEIALFILAVIAVSIFWKRYKHILKNMKAEKIDEDDDLVEDIVQEGKEIIKQDEEK